MKPIVAILPPTRQSAYRSNAVVRVGVKDRDLLLAQTGVGPDRANAAACRLFEEAPIAAALSLGIAGGLSPHVQTGDLIVGDQVILRSSGQVSHEENGSKPKNFACDSGLQETATTILRRWNDRHSHGSILTVDSIVSTSEEKRRLAAESGAMAVDMESAAIAAAASARSIPFLAVRGVLDAIDEDLGIGFDQFLDERGEPRPLPLTRYLMAHPFTIPHLIGLGARTKAICARLGLLLQELSTALS